MKNYNLTPTQDWHFYFAEIFKNKKISSMLEFGLGVGTEYLLDNCEKVTSVELSAGDYNKEWHDQTVKKLKDYKNWDCVYVDLTQDIKDANQRAQKLRFPLEDTKYLKSLKSITDKFLENKKYDFIFVDAGIHTRGDLVNLSFDKADIIAAHDTSRKTYRVLENIYGYNIVNVPENYTEIHYECTYMGTTLWIKNDLPDLIELMKNFKAS
jgi:hypothetical protein